MMDRRGRRIRGEGKGVGREKRGRKERENVETSICSTKSKTATIVVEGDIQGKGMGRKLINRVHLFNLCKEGKPKGLNIKEIRIKIKKICK